MLDMFGENENLTLIMCDEAHFHLNNTVNKQNFRYWASENPRELHQRPLHSPKVTVWCGMGNRLQICVRENGHHLSDIIFHS